MNRIVNTICHRISPFLLKTIHVRVKRNFTINENVICYDKKELLYSNIEILNNLQYKDESWNQIKYLNYILWNDLFKWKYLKQIDTNYTNNNNCINDKVRHYNSTIICQSNGKKNDWIFLKFEKILIPPYLIEFKAKIISESTEFQIAFNYKNLGERYRFNLINNKQLSFEVVYGGGFHNNLITVPFSLHLNRLYSFKILITEDIFTYIVDNSVILSISQHKPIINKGELAFILWDSELSNINVIYQDIKIYKV